MDTQRTNPNGLVWNHRPQLERSLAVADEAGVSALLATACVSFRGIAGRLLVVLARDRKDSLARALERLATAGFELQPSLFERVAAALPELPLGLPDFEAAFTFWPRLDAACQAWLSERFGVVWQSRAGAALGADTLQRLAPMWSLVAPRARHRLPPARACGLNLSAAVTEALLREHVDVDGACDDLVRELLARALLSAPLVDELQGLVGGLLLVEPRWLVERILTGEIVLRKPQPSLALAVVRALDRFATVEDELSAQHVRHLTRFVEGLLAQVAQASNAMRHALAPLLALVARVEAGGARDALLGLVSALALEPPPPTTTPPQPDAATRVALSAPLGAPVCSYEAFLARALGQLSLSELTRAVRPCARFEPSAALSEALATWALRELEGAHEACALLRCLERWVARLCSAERTLAVWARMVDAVGSTSFLLASALALCEAADAEDAREAARAAGRSSAPDRAARRTLRERVVAHALLRLERARGGGLAAELEQTALRALAHVAPAQVAAACGIGRWLALRARPLRALPLVRRWSHVAAESAVEINDSLDGGAALAAALRAHAAMGKVKGKADFARLCDWLEQFVARCPHLGPSKRAFLCARLFGPETLLARAARWRASDAPAAAPLGTVGASAAAVDAALLDALTPLLAAHAPTFAGLLPLLSALGVRTLAGELRALFWRLLDREADPAARAAALRALPAEVRVGAEMGAAERDECVDMSLWEAAMAVAPAPAAVEPPPPPADAAADAASAAAAAPRKMVPPCGVLARFGPRGEAIVREWVGSLSGASQLCAYLGLDPAAHAREPTTRPPPRPPPQQPQRSAHELGWELVADEEDRGGGGAEAAAARAADGPSPFGAECAAVVEAAWRPTALAPAEVECALRLVRWLPALRARCEALVWAVGDEAAVRALMAGVAPDLDRLPRSLWPCVCWARCSEPQLLALARARVRPALDALELEALADETQAALLGACVDDLDAMLDHAPRADGPIDGYLAAALSLLGSEASAAALVAAGDGVEAAERRQSGLLKAARRLLLAVRERTKRGSWLHTSEQLRLFEGLLRLGAVDNANGALLADLLEAKAVDPLHVGELVGWVLAVRGMHHAVRDAALRAMLRLPAAERDALQLTMLRGAEGAARLPLQTLVALAVSCAEAAVVALVRGQLARLSADEWDQLLALICEANPTDASRPPHTFPRGALAADFNERFLRRYLHPAHAAEAGEARVPAAPPARDPRAFRLFVATTERARAGRYVLAALATQRHAPDETLLGALTAPSVRELREVLEYIPHSALPQRLDWLLGLVRALAAPLLGRRVARRPAAGGGGEGVAGAYHFACGTYAVQPEGEPGYRAGAHELVHVDGAPPPPEAQDCLELMRAVLGVVGAHAAAQPTLREHWLPTTLQRIVTHAVCGGMLAHAMLRALVRDALPRAEASRGETLSAAERPLWISFFKQAAIAGAPASLDELRAVLRPETQPLSAHEVRALGVDLAARKLLVSLAPPLALREFGVEILRADPSFARQLCEAELVHIAELSGADDAHWAVTRQVIGAVAPAVALRLAIGLLCHSAEPDDLELLRAAYLAVEPAVRRRVWLPTELGTVWAKLGAEIRATVLDAAVPSAESVLVAAADSGDTSAE